jgi:conjugal transfer pilus assembly protein TraV
MRKAHEVALVAALLALGLAGCKTLVPYESTFMCEKSRDFGRCMDVQQAYEDALGAAPANPAQLQPGAKEPEFRYKGANAAKPTKRSGAQPALGGAGSQEPRLLRTTLTLSPEELYRDREYRELAGLIEQPVTPVVKPPKVLRTLIVSYTAGESLYMPRYVYYFADEARFVLGDYLSPKDEVKQVFPNGPATAPRTDPKTGPKTAQATR